MRITGHPSPTPSPSRTHVHGGHQPRCLQGNPGGSAGAHPNRAVLPKHERSGTSPRRSTYHPPPDIIVLAETNTTLHDLPADRGDYTRVAVTSAASRNQGIEVYQDKRSPWRVDLQFANTLGSALCVKVFTHDTHLYTFAVHAPQVRKVKSFGDHLFWARLWREVLASSHPGRLLMLGDVNSAY